MRSVVRLERRKVTEIPDVKAGDDRIGGGGSSTPFFTLLVLFSLPSVISSSALYLLHPTAFIFSHFLNFPLFLYLFFFSNFAVLPRTPTLLKPPSEASRGALSAETKNAFY